MKGDTVGNSDYILTGHLLGKGTYGVVMEVEHKITQQIAAAKYLCYKMNGRKQAEVSNTDNITITDEETISKEVDLQLRLSHPNILNILTVEDAIYTTKAGTEYLAKVIIMEKARSDTLFDVATMHQPQTLHETIARTYFRQLIEALSYCHGQGVCHRDLKPENLMLDNNYALKIGDFGEGKVMNKSNDFLTNTAGVGSGFYRAPEIMQTDTERVSYDPRVSDIWSCGVILFALLSGVPPIESATSECWYYKRLSKTELSLFWQQHSSSHYFPVAAKDLLNKILEPDPLKRITTASIKLHPWYNETILGPQTLTREMYKYTKNASAAATLDHFDNQSTNNVRQGVDLSFEGHRGIEEKSGLEVSDDEDDGKDIMDEMDDDEEEDDQKYNAPVIGFNAPKADSKAVDLYDDESDDEEETAERTFKTSPPVFEIRRQTITCFESRSDLSTLHRAAQKAAQTYGTASEESEFSWLIEAKDGSIAAILALHAHPDSKKRMIVEVQRLNGNGPNFTLLYLHVVRAMKKCVYTPSEEDEEEEEEEEEEEVEEEEEENEESDA